MSIGPSPPTSETARAQRLKDIQDALAGRPVDSERQAQAPDPTRDISRQVKPRTLAGREQRLKAIQDALAGKEGVSEKTRPTTIPTTKRTSPSTPEPPPTAKRRKVESSFEIPVKVPPTHLNPRASRTVNAGKVSSTEFIPLEEPFGVVKRRGPTKYRFAKKHHIIGFFAKYPLFRYNPAGQANKEFHRMCNYFSWDRSSYKKARKEFGVAMTQQFNTAYGTDVDDLDVWQELCRVLGVIPVPEELKECVYVVTTTHVNIVDLMETQYTGDPVQVFDSEKALSKYTRRTEKFFPLEEAYAGGLLRYLLRKILSY